MVRKERSITVKVIENKKIYDKLLIDFFAKKYDKEMQIKNRKKKDILIS